MSGLRDALFMHCVPRKTLGWNTGLRMQETEPWVRLPNQSGYSVPTGIAFSLGLDFPKVSSLVKMVYKSEQEKPIPSHSV